MYNDLEKIVEKVVREVSSQKQEEGKITLRLAKQLAEKIEAEAAKIGVNAVVAIADAGARPILAECMDDAYIASYDIAVSKAYTSVALKMRTADLKKLAQPEKELYGIQFTNAGQIVIFGGGEPLFCKGKVIGGLGVSGGTEEKDTYLAAYGAELFNKLF